MNDTLPAEIESALGIFARDDALHEGHVSPAVRKELCDACDDFLAGEELPRNRAPSSPPATNDKDVTHG